MGIMENEMETTIMGYIGIDLGIPKAIFYLLKGG